MQSVRVGPRFVLLCSPPASSHPVYYRLPARTVLGVFAPLHTHSVSRHSPRSKHLLLCGCSVDDLHILIFTAWHASEVRHALGAVALTALLPTSGAGKVIRIAHHSPPPQHRQHGKVSIVSALHRLARDISASLVAACVYRSRHGVTQRVSQRPGSVRLLHPRNGGPGECGNGDATGMNIIKAIVAKVLTKRK